MSDGSSQERGSGAGLMRSTGEGKSATSTGTTSDSSDPNSPPTRRKSPSSQTEVKATASPAASTARGRSSPGGDAWSSDSDYIPSSQIPPKLPSSQGNQASRENEPSTSQGVAWRGVLGEGSGDSSTGATSGSSGQGSRQGTPEPVEPPEAALSDRGQMLVQLQQRVAQQHSRRVASIMRDFGKLDTKRLHRAVVSPEVFQTLLTKFVLLLSPEKK